MYSWLCVVRGSTSYLAVGDIKYREIPVARLLDGEFVLGMENEGAAADKERTLIV